MLLCIVLPDIATHIDVLLVGWHRGCIIVKWLPGLVHIVLDEVHKLEVCTGRDWKFTL